MRKSQMFACFICPLIVTSLAIINVFYIKDLNIKIIINAISFVFVACQFGCILKQDKELKNMIKESKTKYDN